MALAPFEVVSSGVDWITLTAPIDDGGIALASAAAPLLKSEEARGCIVKPWSMSGFEGFLAGHVACGTRSDRGIVRLSSDMAQKHWRRFHGLSKNCSRIDVQSTYRFLETPACVIAECYRNAISHARKHKGCATVSIWQEYGGSSTVYFGKRVSERFARIYDKYAESCLPEFGNCVRFELELKGEQAYSVANELAHVGSEFATGNNYPSEVETVCSWLADYFGNAGVRAQLAGTKRSLLRSAGDRSDLHRTLQWIRNSVSPSVERLCSCGFALEAIEALFGSLSEVERVLIAVQNAGPRRQDPAGNNTIDFVEEGTSVN